VRAAATVLGVSPRARIASIVAVIATAAAGTVVAITWATHTSIPAPPGPRPGKPPYAADWTAPAPLSKTVERAMRSWPEGTVPALQRLARVRPGSSFVRLNLGLALYWQRDDAGALAAWRAAKRVEPDTPSAVKAGDLLHPNSPQGLPQFQPSFARPRTAVQRLLVSGVRLQQSGRPVSAEREFARAAKLAPDDPDAQVAAAVGLFDKDRPSLAFGRLGPLARRFPRSQTVRFHLGLLSIWIGAFADARRELRLLLSEGGGTAYAREARPLLKRLENVGTG
jgi:tetratricopeptide (TPR) repeat protein